MNTKYKISIFTGINIIIFIVVLGYSIYSLFCYGFEMNGQPFYATPKMDLGFADLRQLTYSSGCSASIDELISDVDNCDPYKRLFNYTPVSLLLLRLLKVDYTSTNLIGFLMGLVAILTTIIIFFNFTNLGLNIKLFASSLFIGSSPFQLALERGNYDLLIMILFVLFALLVNSTKYLSGMLRFITICLAALSSFFLSALKVFPVLGITLWYFFFQKNNKLPLGSLWIIFPAVFGVVIQSKYISSILSNTPMPSSGVGFGVLSLYQGTRYFSVIIVVKIAIALATIYLCSKLDIINQKAEFNKLQNQDIFCLSLLIFMSVYIVSNSFDYRLIFLIFAVPSIFNFYTCEELNTTFKVVLAFLIFSIFFVAYEQYAFGRVGILLDLLSDGIVQPTLFITLTFLIFKNQIKSIVFSFKVLMLKA